MLAKAQALKMAAAQAQEDFPDYALHMTTRSVYEQRCWYICIRLSHHQTKHLLDCWYGVYFSHSLWRTTLFDLIPLPCSS